MRGWNAAAVLLAISALPVSASAAQEYVDPPSYKGIKEAPDTEPLGFPTVSLSSAGAFPSVLVDEAGTAHIAWNEGRGDAADVAVYCRLPRGADACDERSELTWDKTYGSGDGPQFNIDNFGPKIVRVGDQLVILSKRYPTVADKPDGASSSTVVGWISDDGGSEWSDAAILGKRDLGQLAVVGPDDDPTIVNLSYDPFCGGMCATEFRSGVYSTDEGVLNTDPNSNYEATLVAAQGELIAAFSDLNPRIWLRRWNGTGSPVDPANWTTSVPIPGHEPELAAGPAGEFMLHRSGYSQPYQVSKLATDGGGVVSSGEAVQISEDAGVAYGKLAQDPSGRLLAAFQDTGVGVQLRTSTAGAAGFQPPQPLIDGDLNGQIDLDATDDGGGFAVLNHTGATSSEGEITAVGFGNQGPTGELGLGDLPGGSGDVSCQYVGFGDFAIETVEGCFLKGTGNNSNLVVTTGRVTLNGLVIDPDEGSKLVMDPVKLTLDTIGQVRVLTEGGGAEVVLYHGELARDLSGLGPGSRLFEFPVSEFQANVLGFDIPADIPVQMTEEGVRIPVDIKLPDEFGGFTGNAVLIAKKDIGLELDSLRIEIGPIPLGVLIIENVVIDWEAGGTWRGEGKLTVPAGGSIEATVAFEEGEFAGAGFDYPLTPPAVLGPFVYLLSVGGDFFLRPEILIAARATLAAGAAIQGEAPVKVDGEFTMRFPEGEPAEFDLTGKVSAFVIEVGEGFLHFETNGYAEFGGSSHLELGPLSGGMNVEGFVDASGGQFGATMDGSAEFCAEVDIELDTISVCGGVGTSAAVSSKGFAACARINPPDPIGGFSAGLAMFWEDLDPGLLFSPIIAAKELIEAIAIPCSTGAYAIPPPGRVSPALARRGGQGLVVDGGLPTATILVKGTGGTPSVTVNGPDGATVGSGEPSDDGVVVGVEGTDAVWVLLESPPGGNWTVTPDAGSPTIDEILVSEGYEPAEVGAEVARGKIDYEIRKLGAGQSVGFVESGEFGTNIIGEVDDANGTLRFKPAGGAGGEREVTAQILRDGLVTDEVPIGSYKAPKPKGPGAVKKLRGKRSGSTLTVTFRPHKDADRTAIKVKGKGGTEIAELVGGDAREASLSGLRWAPKLKVTVYSISEDGTAGKKQTINVR